MTFGSILLHELRRVVDRVTFYLSLPFAWHFKVSQRFVPSLSIDLLCFYTFENSRLLEKEEERVKYDSCPSAHFFPPVLG